MSLNVSLPPELEKRVRAHVASGLFGSASEVIREALRLFESYHTVQGATLAALQADIEQGLADQRGGGWRLWTARPSKPKVVSYGLPGRSPDAAFGVFG